jgi:hypothetical protein
MAKKIESKTSLSWLIDHLSNTPLEEGEFTISMALEALVAKTGKPQNRDTLRNRLLSMKAKGLLTSRHINIDGQKVAAYKPVT